MKRIRKSLVGSWRLTFLAACGVAAAALMLSWNLSSLAPHLSQSEATQLASSNDWHKLINNPEHAPLKLLEWLTVFAPHGHDLFFARLPSVVLALLSLVLLGYILRRWYGPRTTVFGLVIFTCSAWFLHIGRFAGVEVEYLAAMLAILAAHIGLFDHENSRIMLFLWLLANILFLYIPGFVWFVILGIVWQRTELIKTWRQLSPLWLKVLWLGAAGLGLAAPTYALIRTPMLWRSWLGLPTQFDNWRTPLLNAAHAVEAIVYKGPHNPELWLATLAVLDVFLSVMLLAGIIFYARHWRATRTHLLLAYFIIGVILTALGGIVRLSVIIPIIYLVAIAGIAYILHFWMAVFPRNGLARATGIAAIIAVSGLSCSYNLDQYFIAWPHSPETMVVYRQ